MPGWEKDGLSGRGANHIKCPYYIVHSHREILCEGHVPDTKVLIRFKSDKQKAQQQHIFCEECYERCEHYISVSHFKWTDE